ncbi:MAG TPA: beta/gamma crystallin-related protein [Usitatibacter sp.]|nr:beta/gamma crystallin-related protein [Usitatibacter sp.]
MKRTLIGAAVAAAMLAGAAHAAEFIIYKGPNYQGESHSVKGEVADLANDGGFAQNASSVVVKGGYWEVCTKDHFQGECRVLAEGEYPRLGRDLNNKIYSVRFLGADQKYAGRFSREYRDIRDARREAREDRRDDRRDAREERRDDRREMRREGRREWRDGTGAISLYGGRDFGGRSVRVEDNAWDLSASKFDGRASSVVVHEGTWQLCTEPGYQGRCSVLTPGEYRQLAALDDRVSSLRQLR